MVSGPLGAPRGVGSHYEASGGKEGVRGVLGLAWSIGTQGPEGL